MINNFVVIYCEDDSRYEKTEDIIIYFNENKTPGSIGIRAEVLKHGGKS